MLSRNRIAFMGQIAKALTQQFGENCEVLVHEVDPAAKRSHIAIIENGHVSARHLDDGPSHVVLEAMNTPAEELENVAAYLTRTHDGRILKSSTVYIKDDEGALEGIFSINYDITSMIAVDNVIQSITKVGQTCDNNGPQPIPRNVGDLLDDLIDEADRLVGKPVPLMSKDDMIRAIKFLNDHGAMLITKSGDKIAKHYNISKYTLYSYIGAGEGKADNKSAS